MFGKANCICLQGLEGRPVSVEADVNDGLPGYTLVGYLASEVREAQDRVRTAIRNLGFSLPPKKVTVNISPGDIRKEGTGFDLAIAAAVLAGFGLIPEKALEGCVFLGELGLDGRIKGIPGMLVLADEARRRGFLRIYTALENRREAGLISGIEPVGVYDLKSLVGILTGKLPADMPVEREIGANETVFGQGQLNRYDIDFSEVNGQPLLRRAAEIAAAGRHNLLMIGPAGSGKTMIARRMPTILPALELKDCIGISKIYSVGRLLPQRDPLIRKRPFRAPHHTVSAQALVGGGLRPKPGEISLASGGILFLDELPEMSRTALESLRQPLEERSVTLSRVGGTFRYPADFQLVAAMNPCKCGHYPDLSRCTCSETDRRRYRLRISRPLLDRIDLCVEASPLNYAELASAGENESSEAVRRRVEAAAAIQKERFSGRKTGWNSRMSGSEVREFCALNAAEKRLAEEIFETFSLSARSYDGLLKTARTIADLDGSERIGCVHLSEAVSYVRVKSAYWEGQG